MASLNVNWYKYGLSSGIVSQSYKYDCVTETPDCRRSQQRLWEPALKLSAHGAGSFQARQHGSSTHPLCKDTDSWVISSTMFFISYTSSSALPAAWNTLLRCSPYTDPCISLLQSCPSWKHAFLYYWLNRASSRVEGQMSFRSALHISNKTWLTASWLQTLYSWWQHGRGTKDTAGCAEPKMSSAELIIRRNHLFDLWAEHIWTEISEGE